MIRRRHDRRRVPSLNTTATGDISFMLLVFFLVITSMDTDKGLLRKLLRRTMKRKRPLPTLTSAMSFSLH